MVKGIIDLRDVSRLHLRPATKLGKIACQYKCSVKLVSGNISANVKSIISLLGSCVKFEDEVELICDGEDENEAFEAIKKALDEFKENEEI